MPVDLTNMAKDKGAMATFYNPFDVKKKSDDIARVAEEEERSMSVQFGNRLSIPLEVRRCQLEFNDNCLTVLGS